MLKLARPSAGLLAPFALVFLLILNLQATPNFSAAQVFASGSAVQGTSPDSIFVGGGSVWVAFQNGADSTGAFGSSTVVRYSMTGTVQQTWSILGNVDGLRPDPSGTVWALQNNDGNSTLTLLQAGSSTTTLLTYGNSYTNVPNRGFDDVVFTNGNTFLSETNPASNSDPIVLKLTSGVSSPLQVAGILNSQFTGVNLATGQTASDTITDSDSLILRPNGDLVLTGEADRQLVFIPPGPTTVSFLNLFGVDGKVDDSAFNGNATSGYFLFTDTGANTVYKINVSGLSPNMTFVDIGHDFGWVNMSTGLVTPIFVGQSPHGLVFVPSGGSPTPEPGTLMLLGSGLLGVVARRFRQ
jgi:hypothetical protein